jgi:peptidoglycan hydrolase-like protein with peptidoglycan-binding domain
MILMQGSTGPVVVALQQKLQNLGFSPKGIDGQYGPNTAAAVRAYQSAWGLRATGVADDQTLQSLGLTTSAGAASNPTFKSGGASAMAPGGTAAVVAAAAGSSFVDAPAPPFATSKYVLYASYGAMLLALVLLWPKKKSKGRR